MNKNLVVLSVFILLSSLNVATRAVANGPTVVKVDPSLIEYHTNATGQQFTIAVKIVDVTNLYGFDIKFGWNTTYLEYVNHSIRIPKDTYPDGVLWNPIIPIIDQVNITSGTYWIAYTSRWPAPSFNGSGTVFTITFKIKSHPVVSTAQIILELYSTDLSDNGANPIPHIIQNGKVILYALAPPVGGVQIPIDKIALLAPYVAYASVVLIGVVAMIFKRRKMAR
ncbi:MAG: cohesin domain-containing protein [Candidatus Bathyarchaeia archaeon]